MRQQLYALRPEFCSVTYGAGGSTQEGTFGTVREILAEGVSAASHFSCIGATRQSVREQLAQLRAMGVQRLVALRGDLPSGYGMGGEFHYASDLVAFIRAETGQDFHIEVAAYPEVHPQARSPEADLKAYVTKVQAGADAAITQYFYSADAYFRFVEDARRQGPLCRWCPASCPSPVLPSSCAFRMPVAPRSRAGSACACRRTVTTWLDPRLRPGCGHGAVRAIAGSRRACAAFLHHEPECGDSRNLPPPGVFARKTNVTSRFSI